MVANEIRVGVKWQLVWRTMWLENSFETANKSKKSVMKKASGFR